jgi:hypothetical protein
MTQIAAIAVVFPHESDPSRSEEKIYLGRQQVWSLHIATEQLQRAPRVD